ncbi:MAG: TadE/TadG family type IV pilus assembly protein [Pseudomonadota bacterium]
MKRGCVMTVLHRLRTFRAGKDGTALIEAALLIPVMLTLLMGIYDIGNGIMLNQRTITASQVAADLISRDFTVTSGQVNEVIAAARLSFQPYASGTMGIDIASVEFDDQERPVVLWRETRNMAPNQAAVSSVQGLGEEGDGLIIVTIRYTYVPHFGQMFMNAFNMQEVAFTRGRRSPTVEYAG